MLGRYVFSIVVGVTVTLGLLFVMQLLIASGKAALTEPRERYMLEFVRVRRNENINTEDFQPEKPPKPPEVPPEVPPQDMDNIDPNAPTINVAAPHRRSEHRYRRPGRHEYRRRRLSADRARRPSLSGQGAFARA